MERQPWQRSRNECIANGGDLAFHGFDSIGSRIQIAEKLGLYDIEVNCCFYIGIHRIDDVWTYVDGTPAYEEEIYWKPGYPISTAGYDCAVMKVLLDNDDDLLTYNFYCSSYWYGICEFEC